MKEQSRYEWLLAKFASLDKRIGELKTRECETSAALTSAVQRYERACKAYALGEGGDPEPIRRDRQKFEAELCGIRGAIADCQAERASFQSEWQALGAERERAHRAQAKEAARQKHSGLLEKRAVLLTQLSSLDDEITRALFEWQRLQTEEAYQNDVMAQNAWKEEANTRAPGIRRVVTIGGQ